MNHHGGEQGGPLILVVDDDDMVLRAVRRMVSALGYGVITTRLPELALELILADPDIVAVISDVEMPKLRGPELVEKIRAHGLATPVLLMSGGVEPSAAAPVLEKPFTRAELAASLADLGVTVANLYEN